jgi:hypothetical protein
MGFDYLNKPIVPENMTNISQQLLDVHKELLSVN